MTDHRLKVEVDFVFVAKMETELTVPVEDDIAWDSVVQRLHAAVAEYVNDPELAATVADDATFSPEQTHFKFHVRVPDNVEPALPNPSVRCQSRAAWDERVQCRRFRNHPGPHAYPGRAKPGTLVEIKR